MKSGFVSRVFCWKSLRMSWEIYRNLYLNFKKKVEELRFPQLPQFLKPHGGLTGKHCKPFTLTQQRIDDTKSSSEPIQPRGSSTEPMHSKGFLYALRIIGPSNGRV